MYKLLYVLLFTLLAVAISSCVANPTPYQPLNEDGGYKEEKQINGSYKLIYVGNLLVDMNTVKQYWQRRAVELCGNTGYTHEFTDIKELKTQTEESGVLKITTAKQFPSVKGNVVCK